MKEKIKKHKREIFLGTCTIAMVVCSIYGAKRAHFDGYQRGCDVTFHRFRKEFPDLNLSEFWDKYHG